MCPDLPHVNPKSAAYKLRTLWLRTALSDPCLFHALLFSASCHLDVLRGGRDNPVTLYHYGESIRFVNKSLSCIAEVGLPNTTIAATLALGHFNVRLDLPGVFSCI